MSTIPLWMHTTANDITLAAAAVFLLFVVQYTLTSPWWRDAVGATVVIMEAVLLGILLPASARIFWPGLLSPYTYGWITIGVLGTAVLVMAWRCVVWWRIRKPWPFKDQHRTLLPRRRWPL